jgi:CRISPR system Cascade subunit CasE
MPDLYLSQLTLNPRSRAVQGDLADCHALHQRVMMGFPTTDPSPRATLGILYRLDLDARTGIPCLLVQAHVAPDWTPLQHTEYLATAPLIKSIGETYAAIRTGTRLRFRLQANPTKRVGTGQPGAGKRVELQREPDQMEWLARQGATHGFRVLDARVRGAIGVNGKIHGWQRGEVGAARRLTVGTATFDGALEVIDGMAFLAALRGGIGPAKAYGCGLLSIAPS